MDQFSSVLKSIVSSIYEKDSNATSGYVLFSDIHGMAINITKDSDVIIIQFYDPNATNIAKKVILLHPDDTDNLNIDDFITWDQHKKYFFNNNVRLFSIEKVTKTADATVHILGDISKANLGLLLAFGHYKKNLNVKDNIIIKPIISQIRESSYMDIMALIAWYVPFITEKVPYYYNEISGFEIACRNKHLETVANYMDDLLSSNNSIKAKIAALFSPEITYIANSLTFGDSNLWEVTVKSILINQNISSTEKVIILNKLLEGLKPFPILFVPFAPLPKDLAIKRKKEVQLASVKKLADYILETDALTEEDKLEVIQGVPLLGRFWLYHIINVNETEKYLDFCKLYLDIILNCNKISNEAKQQLVDLHLSTTEKEEVLYLQVIETKNFNFAITYIEKIIKSTLTTKAKQELLNIEDEDICSKIYVELEKNHPELAKLCCAIIPSYKKIYMKQNE